MSENENSMLYDAFSSFDDTEMKFDNLTNNDLRLITKAFTKINLSILHQYHNWLLEQLDEKH